MQIKIRVVPNAKRNMVKKEEDRWKVYVTAPAIDGKANKAVLKFMAGYMGLRLRECTIIKGLKSRDKTISIVSNK